MKGTEKKKEKFTGPCHKQERQVPLLPHDLIMEGPQVAQVLECLWLDQTLELAGKLVVETLENLD